MTQDELKARFILRDDGVFVNRYSGEGRSSTMVAGRAVGNVDKDGYITVAFNKRGKSKTYKAHRLVWLWHFGEWPSHQIDHINKVKADNRIENLRLATAEQNMANRTKMRNNTTGYKGVFRSGKKFFGSVQVNGIRHRTDACHSAGLANIKAELLRIKLHGEYVCHKGEGV